MECSLVGFWEWEELQRKTMEESEKCHRLWNVGFGAAINTYVSSTFSTGVNSDISIVCNNVSFKCHKVFHVILYFSFPPILIVIGLLLTLFNLIQVILSMQCKQLRSLISEEHDVLIIPDIHQDKVGKLLTFLYQGVLDIHRTEVGDFLGLIEQWGISPEVTFLPKPKVFLSFSFYHSFYIFLSHKPLHWVHQVLA